MKSKILAPILFGICIATLRGATLAQTTAVQTRPDDNAPVIALLKAGTEPVPAPDSVSAPAGWMAVSVAGPFDGYVVNSDLTKQLDVRPGAPIRLEPKPDAGIITVGEKGDKTHLTGLHGNWTQIRVDKTLIAYIRTGAAAASPSPSPLPPPRDLSAPISTIGAAPGASAAAPQPAPSGETSPAGLARSFEGRFASTRHPFSPRRPYDWELLDGSGRRYAYLNIGKLLLTDQIENYSNHEVAVFGALKPVPGGKDLVIEVESLRLR